MSTAERFEQTEGIPPLVAGDRLTRDEFERRYLAMTDVKKAELIEGVVYMPSPVSQARHGVPNAHIAWWLGHYRLSTPGVDPGVNPTVRLDLDNEPQPDSCMRILPACGGQTRDSSEGYIEGAPELVVEIAASSVSYDLHDKFRAYRRSGVCEYVVWRVDDDAIDWFRLTAGDYEQIEPDTDGVVRSSVFPGLWLDVPAMIERDMLRVRDTLDRGTGSPEHAAFVDQLGA